MVLEPLAEFTTKVADFLDKPNPEMSAEEVKAQFDAAAEELRLFLNSKLTQIDTDFALKSEITSALLGQIIDGSLNDEKLSNGTGQVKDRLSKVITDLADFIATKGFANGFGSLGIDGKAPLVQIPTALMVASSRTVDISVPQLGFDNTVGNNVVTNGDMNWFTFMNKNMTKTKGMRNIRVINGGAFFPSTLTGKGGAGGGNAKRVYINGVLKSDITGNLNITYDITDIADGATITLQVDLKQEGQGVNYAYGVVTVSTNEVFDIL